MRGSLDPDSTGDQHDVGPSGFGEGLLDVAAPTDADDLSPHSSDTDELTISQPGSCELPKRDSEGFALVDRDTGEQHEGHLHQNSFPQPEVGGRGSVWSQHDLSNE